MDEPIQNEHTLATLIRELRTEASTLLRQETALAKAELSEKASHLGGGASRLAIGSFVTYAGALLLLFGLAGCLAVGLREAGLDPDTAQWLAPALLGLLVALIGWMLVARAKRAFSTDAMMPEQTLQSLRDNKQWAQNKLQQRHEPAV